MLGSVEGTRPRVAPGSGTELVSASALAARDDLIERDGELETLAAALARLEDRVGGVVTITGPAGLGKTTLVEQAIAGATGVGYRVRAAAAGPQERHFAYGVIRTLLETPLRDADGRERARLLDGAAGQAGDLL